MTNTLKLYESRAQIAEIDEWISTHPDELLANGGALPPDLAQLLAAAEGAFEQKAERVALKVRELLVEADAIQAEKDRLAQREKATRNAAESLKEYLKRHMEAVGLLTVKGTYATIAIQPNQPAVHGELSQEDLGILFRRGLVISTAIGVRIDAVNRIPESYVLDKKAILQAHKAGAPLPTGLTVTHGSSLRIR